MTNLDHLIKKHHDIDLEISRIHASRKPELMSDEDLAHLHLLKKRKLALKDKIETLKKQERLENLACIA